MTSSDLEAGAQVAASCPACSGTTTPHEVLKPAGQSTVRCLDCGHVHKVAIQSSSTVSIRTIVSSDGEADRTSTEVPRDEELAIGEEFITKLEGTPVGVRITSLELEAGDRVESAEASKVHTIWTRAVDNVSLSVTVHPADGRHDATVSETIFLPGDTELTVGETIPHEDRELRVEQLLLRDDAVTADRHKLDRRGDTAMAKDIDRLFAREEGDEWRSAWG